MPMKAQGWYRDPYGVHEDRYFSDGKPTKLVRDGGAESYDPPPPRPPDVEPDEMTPRPPVYGGDLRRADDPSARSAFYDTEAAWYAVQQVLASNPPM
jgi:hypothetical protein